VVELKDGALRRFEITPAEAGLPMSDPAALKGGEPGQNAAALRAVLAGEKNAYRDIALFNAAAALVIADKALSLRDGVAMGASALDEGRAAALLARVVETSNAGIA